eukprot:TRINITY_DN6751_c1_g1_i2.p1 TRINITY_DN6751_c1_g1~~TRINITY_DN6751_c1_g1_i2.p1  ORF type:complete len:296 (+),score=29.36 TRINITY_DN6751_c1_g1_i2:43-930(+)
MHATRALAFFASFLLICQSCLTCQVCPGGSFANSTICSGCPSGSCPTTQLCSLCAAGSFSRGGSSQCELCCPGSFSREGSFRCTPCLRGEGSSWGSVRCEICPVGHFSAHSTCNTAALCPSFNIASSTFLSSATHSFHHIIQSQHESKEQRTKAQSCCPCPPGTYGDRSSVGICLPCGAGFFNPDIGTTSSFACAKCPNGYFCPNEQTAEPILCPKDHSCKDGAKQPLVCSSLQSATEGSSDCEMNASFLALMIVGIFAAVLTAIGMALAYKHYYHRDPTTLVVPSAENPVYQGF